MKLYGKLFGTQKGKNLRNGKGRGQESQKGEKDRIRKATDTRDTVAFAFRLNKNPKNSTKT